MGDERAANPEYAEDVDVMILEYLIYSTMKACVDDFTNRRVGQAKTRPSQSVLTQIHILSGKNQYGIDNSSTLIEKQNSCNYTMQGISRRSYTRLFVSGWSYSNLWLGSPIDMQLHLHCFHLRIRQNARDGGPSVQPL